MPKIYLSPSLQEYNPYVDGGNEEYYMNLIADAMEPYLNSSGIQFTRNEPSQKLSQAIAQSNAGNYDLHLALHSTPRRPPCPGRSGEPMCITTTAAPKERGRQRLSQITLRRFIRIQTRSKPYQPRP